MVVELLSTLSFVRLRKIVVIRAAFTLHTVCHLIFVIFFSLYSSFSVLALALHLPLVASCRHFTVLFRFCHIIKHKVKPIEKCIRTSYILFYRIFRLLRLLVLCAKNANSEKKRVRDLFLCSPMVDVNGEECVCRSRWMFMCVMKSASFESKIVEWYQSVVKRQIVIKEREKRRVKTTTKTRNQLRKPPDLQT